MTENYIQFASGYQKDNIEENKDLSFTVIFEGHQTNYHSKEWNEVT